MPHRISIHITIGGLLSDALVPGLFAAAEQEGATGSWGGGPLAGDADELREIVIEARAPLWVCDDQHLGNFDALEAFCVANGLTFVSHSEGGDEADAEIRWWAPGLEAVRSEAALEGVPRLPAARDVDASRGGAAREAPGRPGAGRPARRGVTSTHSSGSTMNIARIPAACVLGVRAEHASIEIAVAPAASVAITSGAGFPRDAAERVACAVRAAEPRLPPGAYTFRLAIDAVVPGGDSHLDLALAVGAFAVSAMLPESHRAWMVAGELALDGSLRPVRGAILLAAAASEMGLAGIVLPRDNLAEASLVDGVDVRGADTLSEVIHFRPDVVLVDLSVPGRSGMSVVDLLATRGEVAVVVTGSADVAPAVEAMQRGASDYLVKPLDPARLRAAVEQALRGAELRRLADALRSAARPSTRLGVSAQMTDLARRVELAARCPDTSVLVLGESGTGKGHVARMLHAASARARAPFVEVNCGGLSATFLDSELFGHEKGAFTDAKEMKPGLFEVANRGTIFLDEVGDLAPELQPKLLKVLEQRRFRRLGGTRELEVDVRVVAATNRDLRADVKAGRFREDLYYRLSVFPLMLPPLRARAREDVVELIQVSLADLRRRCPGSPDRLSAKAMGLLVDHGWPGNVRELRNALEFGLVVAHGADHVEPRHLPDYLREAGAPRANRAGWEAATLEEVERRHVERTLHMTGGNRTLAAEKLGISRATLHAKIRSYGLEDVGRPRAGNK